MTDCRILGISVNSIFENEGKQISPAKAWLASFCLTQNSLYNIKRLHGLSICPMSLAALACYWLTAILSDP
jgi:hypothetical protein